MNLSYTENYKELAKGDTITFECVEEVPDITPIKKGTVQKWKVVDIITITTANLPHEHPLKAKGENIPIGFTVSRSMKGFPKQTVKLLNSTIKDDIFMMPKGLFMPFECMYKIGIEKKKDPNSLKKLFKF